MQLTPDNITMFLSMIGCVPVDVHGEKRWYFPASAFASRADIAADVASGAIQPWYGGPEDEESLHVDAAPDISADKRAWVRQACVDAVNEAAGRL